MAKRYRDQMGYTVQQIADALNTSYWTALRLFGGGHDKANSSVSQESRQDERGHGRDDLHFIRASVGPAGELYR